MWCDLLCPKLIHTVFQNVRSCWTKAWGDWKLRKAISHGLQYALQNQTSDPFFCSGNLEPKDPKSFWSPTDPTANGFIIFTDVFPSFPVGDRGILTKHFSSCNKSLISQACSYCLDLRPVFSRLVNNSLLINNPYVWEGLARLEARNKEKKYDWDAFPCALRVLLCSWGAFGNFKAISPSLTFTIFLTVWLVYLWIHILHFQNKLGKEWS